MYEHSLIDQQPIQDTEPVAERPSCLVLHGLGGGTYELQPLIDALQAQGLRVLAPVLPGHDGPGTVMPASSWLDWLAVTESAFDELAASGEPVVCLGFSTGATLALYLASRRPVARLVLMAPFLAIRYTSLVPLPALASMRLVARVLPSVPRRPPAVRDREMRRWAAQRDRFRTFSLRATASALELIEKVKILVPTVTVPTLIVQGARDTVVEPAQASWLYRNLGSSEKHIIRLPRTDHLVALDHERSQVIAAALAFATEPTVRPAQELQEH
jgi:carboxylesterase